MVKDGSNGSHAWRGLKVKKFPNPSPRSNCRRIFRESGTSGVERRQESGLRQGK